MTSVAPRANGPHDLGGTPGLGPIPIEVDEPVFHEPWHATAFASALGAMLNGISGPPEHRANMETLHPIAYRATGYW